LADYLTGGTFMWFPRFDPQSLHWRLPLSLFLLLLFGILVLAHWKRIDFAPTEAASIPQGQRPQTPLQAELVTITPNGFEPAEITRPQGRFLFAVDNRSGLDDVDLYLERETSGRVNVPLSRKGKLAWREAIDLPPGTYLLRASNDETLSLQQVHMLLERVIAFAAQQRAHVQREKLELENLLQAMTSRLDEITAHFSGELDERNAARDDTEKLNQLVTVEVEQLRTEVEDAADLAMLRMRLKSRLDRIIEHVQDFRTREEVRVRTYRDRVQGMRARIAALERESRSLREALHEEQRLAMIDALTGIPNRAAYDDRIEQEFKRWKRFGRAVSILAWDIDRFKAINDAYGHKAGDKVLRVVGQHLASHVRDTDFVARYGGEEFVMLLVGTTAEEALVVAEDRKSVV
jgi:GGDEF domain-containing protein